MSFKFPFTNYHELNLTWVLDKLKELFEESAENVSTIQNYDGRLTAVETELPTVSETASEASRSAAAAGTLAQSAKATADTAQKNAVQAQSLAGTARQEAQAAQRAADAATQAAQQAQATAQNFDGRITQAENDASQALEASRSFENRVQSAITTANNAARTATDAQGVAQNAYQNASTALDRIGNLSALETTNKNNLVSAINEVITKNVINLESAINKLYPNININKNLWELNGIGTNGENYNDRTRIRLKTYFPLSKLKSIAFNKIGVSQSFSIPRLSLYNKEYFEQTGFGSDEGFISNIVLQSGQEISIDSILSHYPTAKSFRLSVRFQGSTTEDDILKFYNIYEIYSNFDIPYPLLNVRNTRTLALILEKE